MFNILCVASILSFFLSPSELQAEQSVSFLFGVFLSEKSECNVVNKLKTKPFEFLLITLVIGLTAFAIKQLQVIKITYIMCFLQLVYKIFWAITIMLLVLIMNRYSDLKFYRCIGIVSYELYLIHGYMFNWLSSIGKFPLFVLILGISSIILHEVMKLIKIGISKVKFGGCNGRAN